MNTKFDRDFFSNLQAKGYLTDFAITFLKYRDKYGKSGHDGSFTYTEVLRLRYICQNPGLTLKQHREYWNKKKNTMSELVSSLEKKDVIYRERNEENHREYFIFPTEKGILENEINIDSQVQGVKDLISYWNEKFSLDEYYDFLEKISYLTEYFKNPNDAKSE